MPLVLTKAVQAGGKRVVNSTRLTLFDTLFQEIVRRGARRAGDLHVQKRDIDVDQVFVPGSRGQDRAKW